MGEKKLTIEETATEGCCSVRHVHDEVKRENLRCMKLGRRLYFFESDVKKWILRKTKSR
jgi:hypothetical protein